MVMTIVVSTTPLWTYGAQSLGSSRRLAYGMRLLCWETESVIVAEVRNHIITQLAGQDTGLANGRLTSSDRQPSNNEDRHIRASGHTLGETAQY